MLTFGQARAPPVPELERHEDASTSSLVDVDSPHVSSVPSDFNSQEIKTTTQADRIDREEEAKKAAQDAKAKAKAAKDKAAAKARKGGHRIKENADNPVVLGNALLSVALFGALGYGAYVKYKAGEFTWKVVGIGAAVLGAFSVADYYASS
jgi:hypothetical protein